MRGNPVEIIRQIRKIFELGRFALWLLPAFFTVACGQGFVPSPLPGGSGNFIPNVPSLPDLPNEGDFLGNDDDKAESQNPNMIAQWDGKSGTSGWTVATIAAIKAEGSNLLTSPIGDIDLYCPPYNGFDQEEQIAFWLALVSGIADHESGFDATAKLVRTDVIDPSTGQHPVAQGLMQLSFTTGRMYKCDFVSDRDLNDPIKNLWCGVKILNDWVGHDHVISEDPMETVSNKQERVWLGGARYWETLRTPSILDQIKSFTLKLALCQ